MVLALLHMEDVPRLMTSDQSSSCLESAGPRQQAWGLPHPVVVWALSFLPNVSLQQHTIMAHPLIPRQCSKNSNVRLERWLSSWESIQPPSFSSFSLVDEERRPRKFSSLYWGHLHVVIDGWNGNPCLVGSQLKEITVEDPSLVPSICVRWLIPACISSSGGSDVFSFLWGPAVMCMYLPDII